MRSQRAIIAVGVYMLVVVGLSGCRASRRSGAEASTLTIYSGRNEHLVGPVIEQFSEETGIEVQVRYGGTAELAATILEEGDRSPADLFWAQDPGGVGAIEDRFRALPAELLEAVEPRFRSPTERWVGVSGRARVVAYNTERISPAELPASVWDLAEPSWRGRVGWAPTNASFQAMITAMRAVWGEEDAAQWLNAMQANGAVSYPNNTSQLMAVAAGEVDLALVNHYYLFGFLREQGEDFPVRNHHFAGDGPEGVVLVSGVGVLESAANPQAAERFVAFLLSNEMQQHFAEETFEYPVIKGVGTHPLLRPIEEIAAPDIDMAAMADLAGTLDLLRRLGIVP